MNPMSPEEFEKLIKDINHDFFKSSKKKDIKKTVSAFTPDQLYRLVGQFKNGSDRQQVVHDAYHDGRIMPMTAGEANRIITMGVHSREKREIFRFLAQYITDREHKDARKLIKKSFGHEDKKWIKQVFNDVDYIASLSPMKRTK